MCPIEIINNGTAKIKETMKRVNNFDDSSFVFTSVSFCSSLIISYPAFSTAALI